MFWTDFAYTPVNQPLSPCNWQDISTVGNYLHPDDPLLLLAANAQRNFAVLYVRLASSRLPLSHERSIINNLLHDHSDALFIFSNASLDTWHFVHVKPGNKEAKRRILRRFTVSQQEHLRTASERLALLTITEIQDPSLREIQQRYEQAFDVAAATKTFFDAYQKQFSSLQRDLYTQTGDMTWAHDYTHLFLNRCMFLYFIQRKGWLNNNKNFVCALWDAYITWSPEKDTFFHDWLQVLFLKAFNKQYDGHSEYLPHDIKEIFVEAPFLGGLFASGVLDRHEDFTISDAHCHELFTFFGQYNFTLAEDRPLDQEVAIDPEMIGRVYESLVNLDERGDAGIFYTPRTEIDFMCRLSLVDYLANHLPLLPKTLLYDLVFALEPHEKVAVDEELKKNAYWDMISPHLREVTVLDPACGSGAFLVGMFKVLDDLQARANHYVQRCPESDYERRKRIIGQSLYGVEIMQWAAHVAELRLWLLLAVETDIPLQQLQRHGNPILPDFTFQIYHGDSLILPGDFVEISGATSRPGFDIVIGNPPYVRQENISDPHSPHTEVTVQNKRLYKQKIARRIYQTFPDFFLYKPETRKAAHELDAKSDLYVYFYFHALRFLNPLGSFCFITSNSWLDVGYGAMLQEFLLQHCQVKMIIDNAAKRSFATADVNTVITLFSPPVARDKNGQNAMTRFILFTVDFEQTLSSTVFKWIENTQEPTSTHFCRIYPISQRTLLSDGSVIQKVRRLVAAKKESATPQRVPQVSSYLGDKWGGKYLRAPAIYWIVMEKGKDRLKRLGTIAALRYGIKTGANDFFYVDAQRAMQWQIEAEFLRPIIKSPTDCTSIFVQANALRTSLFLCQKAEADLKGTAALEYIRWGESQGFHTNASVRGRTRWWSFSIEAANS
ncbi:MAG TPA: DNA methyltransferase, partial [Ktedonobacteraceae bacterium]